MVARSVDEANQRVRRQFESDSIHIHHLGTHNDGGARRYESRWKLSLIHQPQNDVAVTFVAGVDGFEFVFRSSFSANAPKTPQDPPFSLDDDELLADRRLSVFDSEATEILRSDIEDSWAETIRRLLSKM